MTTEATRTSAGASGTSNVADSSTSSTEETQKLTFWDVLRPLTEQNATTEQSDAPVDISDTTTEQPARELPRRSPVQMNPRRRKARR